MRDTFPEPDQEDDPALILVRLLDFHRATAVRKVSSLPSAEARRSVLPSGWTPLELLNHLAHMEQRWIVWGFLGEHMPDPWGDDTDGRWHVPDEVLLNEVAAMLRAGGERTTRVLTDHPLSSTAATGGRFDTAPPTLAAIALHLLQEYARHVGHLDIAVELAGGSTGE